MVFNMNISYNMYHTVYVDTLGTVYVETYTQVFHTQINK